MNNVMGEVTLAVKKIFPPVPSIVILSFKTIEYLLEKLDLTFPYMSFLT